MRKSNKMRIKAKWKILMRITAISLFRHFPKTISIGKTNFINIKLRI